MGEHGHHVAGTIGCAAHTPATIAGIAIPYDPSGVAPKALLGNYNVFPDNIEEARSEDILNALQAAYEDGMDIVNMSLGGQQNDGGGGWLLANAVDNLDKANMLSAVAAGNEGPGKFTVGFPGAALRALTVGASTVGHSIINQVIIAGVAYEVVVGQFGPLNSDLTAPLAVVADPTSGFDHGLNIACPGSPALPDLIGKIALLGRGTCDFSVKIRAAQDKGAVGVIMVDRVEEAPFVMSQNSDPNQPTIPAVMMRLSEGVFVRDNNDGATTTMKALPTYVRDPSLDGLMAEFSSQGPTMGQNIIVKPDVIAPGANIINAFPPSFCGGTPSCWGMLSGTSMATPHMAGLAAVVKAAHPTWSAAYIRSAIVNTAQEGVLRDSATDAVTYDPLIVGAGLANSVAAVGAQVALEPVSISFGTIAGASGQSKSATIRLTNISGSAKTYNVALVDDDSDGVVFASGGTFNLGVGQSADVTISLTTLKGAPDGNKQATLRVSSSGTEIAHAPLFVIVGSGTGAPGQHLQPPALLK